MSETRIHLTLQSSSMLDLVAQLEAFAGLHARLQTQAPTLPADPIPPPTLPTPPDPEPELDPEEAPEPVVMAPATAPAKRRRRSAGAVIDDLVSKTVAAVEAADTSRINNTPTLMEAVEPDAVEAVGAALEVEEETEAEAEAPTPPPGPRDTPFTALRDLLVQVQSRHRLAGVIALLQRTTGKRRLTDVPVEEYPAVAAAAVKLMEGHA